MKIINLFRKIFGYQCRNCNGSGMVDVTKWYEPYPKAVECWVCHGKGRVEENPNGIT